MTMVDWHSAPLARQRERIATAAMQALIQTMPSAPDAVIARQAIGLADALIAELDKEGK